MKYVQGFEHFDECPRVVNPYSRCNCDVTRAIKANAKIVPVEFQYQHLANAAEEILEAVQAKPEVDASAFDVPVLTPEEESLLVSEINGRESLQPFEEAPVVEAPAPEF